MFRRRTKIVSFRVSEQEYQGLLDVCMERGVRSISDLARERCMGLEGAPGLIEQLRGKVMELDGEVKRLARVLGDG